MGTLLQDFAPLSTYAQEQVTDPYDGTSQASVDAEKVRNPVKCSPCESRAHSKSMGRLFALALTKTAVLRKQWALRILCKRVVLIK